MYISFLSLTLLQFIGFLSLMLLEFMSLRKENELNFLFLWFYHCVIDKLLYDKKYKWLEIWLSCFTIADVVYVIHMRFANILMSDLMSDMLCLNLFIV